MTERQLLCKVCRNVNTEEGLRRMQRWRGANEAAARNAERAARAAVTMQDMNVHLLFMRAFLRRAFHSPQETSMRIAAVIRDKSAKAAG